MLSDKKYFRDFAPTGDSLSLLGLGTVKVGRNQKVKNKTPDGFSFISDDELANLLTLARELGINLIDTAPAYGNSEERLGPWLKKHPKQFFVMSKVGEEFDGQSSLYNFGAEAVTSSLERSLKRLNIEVIDCVMVHCSRNDYQELVDSEVLATLAKLKQRGLIRSFGASINSMEAGVLALKESDALMVTFNPKEQQFRPLIDEAHALKKGIFVKKGLCQGFVGGMTESQSNDEPSLRECMKLMSDTPGITSMIFGTTNPVHLRENVEAMLPYSGFPFAASRRIPQCRIHF